VFSGGIGEDVRENEVEDARQDERKKNVSNDAEHETAGHRDFLLIKRRNRAMPSSGPQFRIFP
jgi:hypothetical protein